MIEVEKGIPLPASCDQPRVHRDASGAVLPLPALWSERDSKPLLYPWLTMDIGDSFFVNGTTISTISPQASARRKISPWRYICRTVGTGVRVWRVA